MAALFKRGSRAMRSAAFLLVVTKTCFSSSSLGACDRPPLFSSRYGSPLKGDACGPVELTWPTGRKAWSVLLRAPARLRPR